MPVTASTASHRCVALFDLDGTLTWRDTLVSFLLGYLGRHPRRWWRLWRAPLAMLDYLATRDRGLLKSRLIRMVMGGATRVAIDAWADAFVGGLASRRVFRPAALAALERHRRAGHHLVLLSASPDLYVPRIGRLLGFEQTVCTQIRWTESRSARTDDRLDGGLLTPNRRGEEKTRCLDELRTRYPGLPVVAYGNSISDLPHLRRADEAILVNGTAAARRCAAAANVPVADWT